MIQAPPNQSPFDENGRPNPMWAEFMSEVYKAVRAAQSSGTTANRPTSGLYVSRFYFDTTINKPIWYTAAGWRDATGTLV